ncbi:MAG: chalcone isomerase family protein [Sterolibacterium sp.]|nr:chalcone isomerase family protein [Sterolibacterium sp.]
MKKLLLVLLLCITGLTHAAVEVAGVKFEDKSMLGAIELQFNGAGQRSKFFLKVYAVALYLTEKKTAAADVLALKGAKRLHIVTLRELTAEQFADALVGGIQKNHTDAEAEPLKARVEEFKSAILALKTAARGDAISIDWLPESGTRLTINGKQQGKDIAGEDFYHALLKIWLGTKPAQDDLKDALLGKPQ